jgi:hypothetical protein
MTTPEDGKRKRWDAVLERIPEGRPTLGAEVGVWRGILSRKLLAERPQLTLYLVDPWRTGVPGTPWMETPSVCPRRPQREFDLARRRTSEVLAPFGDRAQIRRATSVEAAHGLRRRRVRLDFAFIDGDHSRDGCRTDILAWLPLIAPGGWIGGHDYDRPDRGDVTGAVLSVFDAPRVELDAESTWFVRID